MLFYGTDDIPIPETIAEKPGLIELEKSLETALEEENLSIWANEINLFSENVLRQIEQLSRGLNTVSKVALGKDYGMSTLKSDKLIIGDQLSPLVTQRITLPSDFFLAVSFQIKVDVIVTLTGEEEFFAGLSLDGNTITESVISTNKLSAGDTLTLCGGWQKNLIHDTTYDLTFGAGIKSRTAGEINIIRDVTKIIFSIFPRVSRVA